MKSSLIPKNLVFPFRNLTSEIVCWQLRVLLEIKECIYYFVKKIGLVYILSRYVLE